jgi:hypothetical protein
VPRPRAVFGPALFALSLLVGTGAPGSAAAQLQGVKLTGSSDATIRFEVSVPAPRFVTVPAAAGTEAARWLVLDDHESAAGSGDPALPSRVVVVAVPPLGEIQVSAIGADPEVRDAFLLARRPGRPPRPECARNSWAWAGCAINASRGSPSTRPITMQVRGAS